MPTIKMKGSLSPSGELELDIPLPGELALDNMTIRRKIDERVTTMDELAAKIESLTAAQEPPIPRSRVELEAAKSRLLKTLRK